MSRLNGDGISCWVAGLCLWLASAGSAAALSLPPQDSGNFFPVVKSDGGVLHAYTGDRIWQLDDSDPGNPQFVEVVSGLSFFGAETAPRTTDGIFDVRNGVAASAPGFAGGLKITDVGTSTTQEVAALDTANLFSVAVAPGGDVYAQRVAPDFSVNTELIRVDGSTLAVETVVPELKPGDFSGGLTFDAAGNLYASTFGDLTFPTGTATFFKIAADELDEVNPAVELLGTIEGINGAGSLAVDAAGNLYYSSFTAVSQFLGDGQFEVLFGDPTENAFGASTFAVDPGLAYDATTDSLVFSGRNTTQSNSNSLVTLPNVSGEGDAASVPEPATMAAGLAALAALCGRRRRSA